MVAFVQHPCFSARAGEWKLGGFDALSSVKEDDSIIPTYGGLIPDAGRYMAPEVSKGGWEVVKQGPTPAVDAYNFGVLIYEVFNGSYNSSDQLGQVKKIPPSMQQSYKASSKSKSQISNECRPVCGSRKADRRIFPNTIDSRHRRHR